MKKWIEIDANELFDFPTRGLSPSDIGPTGATPSGGPAGKGVTCVTLVVRGILPDEAIAELKERLAVGISGGITRGCDGIGFRGFGVDVCIGRGT